MAKNSIRDYDATAVNNTDVQSTDISEGCAASGINNAIREVMADLKDVSTGAVALESPQADSLTVTGDLTVDTNTLYVDSTNNEVGIGTLTPGGSLEVYKAGTSEVLIGTDNGGTAQLSLYESDDGTKEGLLKYDGTNNRIHLATSGAPNALVIPRDSGRVGIGTSSPSYPLHVDGFIGGKAVEIGRTGGAGHQGGSHFYLGSDLEDPNGPTFTNANYRFFANRTGSVLAMNSQGSGYFYEGTNDDSSSATRQFAVETDGDVRNTNNSYGSLSDQSIKQDIADASSQWEDIKNLQVRKFRLIADVAANADAPYHLGLVAQEVETVSPGLVKVEIQRDALKDTDGNPILDDDGELQMQETGELKAVKYSILYMKAVKALQEAMERIETLEAKVTALENQ